MENFMSLTGALAFLAMSSSLYATTYYVATTGNDTNAGTRTAPFATIQKGVNMAQPGDTVSVADGTYGPNGNYTCGILCSQNGYTAPVQLTNSGTAAAPITITAQNKWGAIIDGGLTYGYMGDGVLCADGVSSCPCNCSDAAFNFNGTASYINIVNFAITRQFWVGALINGAANTNIQFIGNHFFGIGNRYYVVVGSSYGICGVFAGTQSSNVTFDRNEFNNIGRLPTIGKIVSDDYTHDHGLYVLNGPHRIVNNIFYSNSAGWGVQISPGTVNTVITNNTFQGANPQEDGLLMLWANTKNNPDTNITIQNNVFYGARNYAIGNYQAYEVNTLIDHNIVFGSPSGLISQTGIGGTITETNNRINTDPVFANLASWDFHLQGCSPAIDTGAAVVDPTDFDSNPRPLGSAFDVGAYEYDSFNTPPAAAPGSLTAHAVSSTGINLTWSNNAPTATNVLVENSTDNGNFTQIASLTCNAISFSNTGLTPNTQYYYRVRAENAAGTTIYSNTASDTTFNLSAPSALVATAASGTGINLAWTNNSPNATAIIVQDATDNVNFTTIATLAGTATSYAATGLATGTLYYFRVQAQNSSGISGYSNVASATTSMPPPAPSALTATGASATAINLTWKNNASNATAVLVEDSTDSVRFTQIASLGGNATSYSSTGLTAATLYYYRVRAQTAAGLSAYSNIASASTLTPPAAPTALTATAVSGSAINLAWTNNSPTATAILVEDSTNNTTFTQIAQLSGGASSYSSTGLRTGTWYYRVRAQNNAGTSAYSNTASATTLSAPAAPSALSATAASNTSINLSWTNNSPSAAAILIEQSPNNSNFSQIASVAGNAAAYSVTGLTAGTLYYYRVRAQNAVGTSAYSNTASALTTGGSVPAAPSALVATPGSHGKIGLSWTNNSPNATSILVEDSTDNSTFTQIATLSGTATSYSGSGLNRGTLYYFRVRAQNALGTSVYSNTASAKAP